MFKLSCSAIVVAVTLVGFVPAASAMQLAQAGTNEKAPGGVEHAPSPAKPSAPAASSKSPAAEDDMTVGGTRGQLEETISVCDVAPPCPTGCKPDSTGKSCIEKSKP